MKLRKNLLHKALVVVGMLSFIQGVQAVPFVFNQQADIFLGFRKVGVFAENNEAVVDVGSASNYLNMAAGATITVPGYSASQLSPDSFTSFNNLTWAAFGMVNTFGSTKFPKDTIWVTAPRTDINTQTAPPSRLDDSSLSPAVSPIRSIFGGAGAISSRITAGVDNTATFVREGPLNNQSVILGQNLSAYVASVVDPTLGTLEDQWTDPDTNPINIENTTAGNFTTGGLAVRSDLYEVSPNGTVDPNTGLTSGDAYFVGYFTFNTNGIMSFTRAGGVVAPPVPVISITRSGTTNTISFATVNGATYFLLYANSIGSTSWSSNTITLSGNGAGQSFQDVTSGTNRVYRVGAH